jgi:lipoic acid synthetase
MLDRNATFMILNTAPRSCGFWGVKTGRPIDTIDWQNLRKVARSIKLMNIKAWLSISVDRDDPGRVRYNKEGNGSGNRRMNPETTLETLIPDFQGVNP